MPQFGEVAAPPPNSVLHFLLKTRRNRRVRNLRNLCQITKAKKAKRRLREPAIVHLAYAKVLKKLNYCG